MFLHILCAIIWIGGIAFLVVVVVPWLRSGGKEIAGVFLRETGERFRKVGWICFGLLLITGSFNLYIRGVRLDSFVDSNWYATPFGKTVVVKLTAFLLVLLVSFIHDFYVGPQAAKVVQTSPNSEEAQQLRRRATQLGRANALLALILVAAAIMLVRGTP